jgi:hypothetical protein
LPAVCEDFQIPVAWQLPGALSLFDHAVFGQIGGLLRRPFFLGLSCILAHRRSLPTLAQPVVDMENIKHLH